ncbi:uncharacterized protein [Dendrobates tinctorius]|uniref:uncharacterized protein isoform X2 n=1 Tax=Dendrobates tinctorius TaxID=92724 RepID=UPI003CC9B33E
MMCNNPRENKCRHCWNGAGMESTVVDFLDLKLTIEGQSIQTTLYRKSTSTNSVLHYSSFHPEHLRNRIPKGQFYRLKRNCSDDQDFLTQAKDLTRRFKNRGYPCKCPKMYVGQTTQELRKRIQQHLSNINTARTDREKAQCVIRLIPKLKVIGSNQGTAMKTISKEKRNNIIQLIDSGLSTKKLLNCIM